MKKIIAIIIAAAMLLCVSPVVFAEAPLKYVVLGDSIAAGSGLFNGSAACYGKIVADTLGFDYANHGVNGYRSQDVLELLSDEAVLEDLAGADIISISVGGNDFLQQNLPKLIALAMIGDEHHLDNIENDLHNNFTQIIGTIKEVNPDALILAQTLYNTHVAALGAIYDLAVPRVNRAILSYLDENPGAFEVIDLAEAFEGHPEYVAVDTIHPTAVGNEAIAKIITDKLAELGVTEETDALVIKSTGIDEIPFTSYVLKFFFDIFRNLFGIR